MTVSQTGSIIQTWVMSQTGFDQTGVMSQTGDMRCLTYPPWEQVAETR